MNSSLVSKWSANFDLGMSTIVIPDGCRDLIVKTVGNEKPDWFVSPLFDRAELVLAEDICSYVGFRLSPGIGIKERELLTYIEIKQLEANEVKDIISDFIKVEHSVQEALEGLASELGTVKQISAQLGVSIRTLQRLIFNKTNRTPGYWLQLARIRKAARSLSRDVNLADVAENYGFSDQSHMNREFQRWFRLTPVQLLNTPGVIRQLYDQGYG
ncbi:helix-turn-helix domain-containing protein [Thalassomonas actiniarum]|uniref:Helix-turn-helix transcriptional regulator n=1 Tax=Thalassomonas actiniarum TaxID=485447 RepID=A0AAE9YRQ8_9GAMM|nr:helix-turn-helix transcriptional regulator [Thalassomonas actiniarum]WDD98282.1 helix-turn-helix transcriptional regulator [Thalassomonas actiniarum]